MFAQRSTEYVPCPAEGMPAQRSTECVPSPAEDMYAQSRQRITQMTERFGKQHGILGCHIIYIYILDNKAHQRWAKIYNKM